MKNKLTRTQHDYLNKVKEIYTIYYWKTKGIHSIKYFYPDFHERKNSIAYATGFFQYRYQFVGLIHANKNKDICTALEFMEFIF